VSRSERKNEQSPCGFPQGLCSLGGLAAAGSDNPVDLLLQGLQGALEGVHEAA
jgi:hypothetical protein